MSLEHYKETLDAASAVLHNVQTHHMTSPTPCSQYDVSQLINHLIGTQIFFTTSLGATSNVDGDADFASGDFVEAFNAASQAAVSAFAQDGILERTMHLPFGEMTGESFANLAALETLTHTWDVAHATGQPTDLVPMVSESLLEHARRSVPDAIRSESGDPFGLEQTAPPSATAADKLAAFLGRNLA